MHYVGAGSAMEWDKLSKGKIQSHSRAHSKSFSLKSQINSIFIAKSLLMSNISYFASKNDYFYPNICIFRKFVVILQPITDEIYKNK